MPGKRQLRYAAIALAIVALGSGGIWVLTAMRGEPSDNLMDRPSQLASSATRPMSPGELASAAALIAVVNVVAAEPFVPTTTGGDAPAGVDTSDTAYSLRLIRILKGSPKPAARTVSLWIHGEPGDPPDGTDEFFPEVGKRYLVVAGFWEGDYFVLESWAGFTEVTSPEQEAEFVEYWNVMIGATPEAVPSEAVVG